MSTQLATREQIDIDQSHSHQEVDSGRNCIECSEPISEARLKAMPVTSLCRECVERAGDVLLLRRFDEFVGDGVEVQTFFKKPNAYIARQIERLLSFTPDFSLVSTGD